MEPGIIEDEQNLYDWGIENRLDQYYQGDQSSGGQHPTTQQHHATTSQQQEYSSSKVEYSCTPPPSEFCLAPPPAHQDQVLSLTTPNNSRLPHTPTSPFRGNVVEPAAAAGTVQPIQVNTSMMIYRSNNSSRVKDESPVLDMSGWGAGRQTTSGPNTPHYTSYRATSNLHAHCHPQQLHGSPPPPSSLMPPLNLDANEALKVERKRARNRVAASKCRMRKLEKIATLDQQAGALRKEKDELKNLTLKLEEQVYSLQQQLQWHINNGCKIPPQHRPQHHKEMFDVERPTPSPAEIASPDSTTFSTGAPNSPNAGAMSS